MNQIERSPDAAATLPADTIWSERVAFIDRIPQPLAILIVVVAIFGAWQLTYALEVFPPIILPSPLDVFADMIFVGRNLLSGDFLLDSLLITFQEVLTGYVLALLIGFSLGLIIGETGFGEKGIMPILVAIHTMPKVAFAPLFVAWFGFGTEPKTALATFVAFFPIVLATATGLHAADANAKMLFKTMGASRWQTLIKLKLPTGMPHFFVGFRLAAVLVVIGAVVGEFLGGGKGFGQQIRIASSNLDTALTFALIIYLSVVGITLFLLITAVQHRFVFWVKTSVRQEAIQGGG